MKSIFGLLECLVFLSLIVVTAGYFGRFHYLLDLASHFRVHSIVTLLAGGLMLRIAGRTRWSHVGMGVGSLATLALLPYLFAPGPPTETFGRNREVRPIRLMTANVLTTNKQHEQAIRVIRSYDPDIIILLETNRAWVEQLESGLADDWPHFICRPRSDNFGIAIFSRIQWSRCDVVSYSLVSDIQSLDAVFDEHNLRVIATHPMPPMNRQLWQDQAHVFSSLANTLKDEHRRAAVLGDLNCTPWSPCFQQFLQQSGLRDAAKGFGIYPTWSPLPLHIVGLPIDHVLVNKSVDVLTRKVGADIGSDHRPVIVDIR